ncbi:MAG: GNAT family N-acetyltransferase [Chloroflexi bacterium]|nr:GNAT family N-acetyltransferase [Chloroflexota bacterium]
MAEPRGAPITCAPFAQADIPAAVVAAAAAAARLRARAPALPARWSEPAAHVPVLEDLAVAGSGWVARRDGAVLGHHVAWGVGTGRDARTFAPEPGLALAPGLPPRVARRVVEELVTVAGRSWVERGFRTHIAAIPLGDAALRDALTWLGYGILVVDAVRGLDDPLLPALPAAPRPGVRVRRAGRDDLPDVLDLDRGLRRHLVDAPTFLVLPRPQDPVAIAAALADPGIATLLGEIDGTPVALLRVGPSADDVAMLVRDPGTASIDAAFTRREHRGTGVAAALLAAAEEWARERGHVRLAVDFESANVLAARFWTHWFTPVVASYGRRLHPAAGSPEASVDREDLTGTATR